MILSRNEALERLREYREVAKTDPDSAQEMAISVLLDIIEDDHITFSFKMVRGLCSDPLEIMPKILAEEVQ